MKKFKFKIRYIFLAIFIFYLAVELEIFIKTGIRKFEKPYNPEITKSQFRQDCRKLKKYIKKSYIGYYDALENGFNIDKSLSKIQTKFSGQKNIKSEEFAETIFSVITEEMKINDGSFYVIGEPKNSKENDLYNFSFESGNAILVSPKMESSKIYEKLAFLNKFDFLVLDLRNCADEKILQELVPLIFFQKSESLRTNCKEFLKECWTDEDSLLTPTTMQRTWDMYSRYYFPSDRTSQKLGVQILNKSYYTKRSPKKIVKLPQFERQTDFAGKVIVLTNKETALDAEYVIANLFLVDKSRIILVGENSAGKILYSCVNRYFLPNSGIELGLSYIKRDSMVLKLNDKFMGEGEGFIPDFICEPEEISNVISEIIKGASKNISF